MRFNDFILFALEKKLLSNRYGFSVYLELFNLYANMDQIEEDSKDAKYLKKNEEPNKVVLFSYIFYIFLTI